MKEGFIIKNSKSTSGLAINLKLPDDKQHCNTIKSLISQGAIIINKGNIPQALFTTTCSNLIYGQTHCSYK